MVPEQVTGKTGSATLHVGFYKSLMKVVEVKDFDSMTQSNERNTKECLSDSCKTLQTSWLQNT